MLASMIFLAKIFIAVSLVGLLRCSEKFRTVSRRLDEEAYAVLERAMNATEDCGYPRHLVPVLILLTAISFMLSAYFTMPFGR